MGWESPRTTVKCQWWVRLTSGVELSAPNLSPTISATSGGNGSTRQGMCCPLPSPAVLGGWKQPDSTWSTSASRGLVSLLCPFAEPETGFPVCQFWTYILKWQGFFFFNPTGKIYFPYFSFKKVHYNFMPLSPFPPCPEWLSHYSFPSGESLLIPPSGWYPGPAPLASPSGCSPLWFRHRASSSQRVSPPLPLPPHPLSPNPPVGLNRHWISVCLCNISFSSLDWRARPQRQLGSLLYYQQLVEIGALL